MTCSQLTNTEIWQTSRDELHCNEPPETLEATGRHCWNINRNNLVINFFSLFLSATPQVGSGAEVLQSVTVQGLTKAVCHSSKGSASVTLCLCGFILPFLQPETNSYEVEGGAWRDEESSLPPAQQWLANGVYCSSCIGEGSCSLLGHFPPLNSCTDLWLPFKPVLLSHHLLPSAEPTFLSSLLWPQGRGELILSPEHI